MFDIKFTNAAISSELHILLYPESSELISEHRDFDKKTLGLLSQTLSDKEKFDGKFGKIKNISYLDEGNIKYIALLGIGKEKDLSEDKVLELGGKIYSTANSLRTKSVSVDGTMKISGFEAGSFEAILAGGAKLASYRFDKYRTTQKDEEKTILSTLSVLSPDISKAEKHFEDMEAVLGGVFLARDLISEPPNILYPESYANIIEEDLGSVGIDITILGESQMRELGMGALLGVGQGSARESKLVIMEYYGADDSDEKPVAFVGKGVTFDTGGISIKPSAGMGDMKYDMAGSAAVVGVMKALAVRRAKVNAVGVVGLVENMPGGNAQRPSDVVTTMSGKTAEVLDTDAEGRLVLSDALWYTQSKFNPKFMIDLATLTGAIVVALGNTYAGLFSNNDDLVDNLIKSGMKTNEKLWRMPLHKDFADMIKSDIADVANLGNVRGAAGSSTAAHFLQHFVNDIPWAHLDIAGMAWERKGTSITPKGAVGFGVRLLNQLVKDHYESK
jgi:leucyl aminopeptidase